MVEILLLKDCYGCEIKVKDLNDWICIRLKNLKVVTWLLKDCYDNDIELTDMNYWFGMLL